MGIVPSGVKAGIPAEGLGVRAGVGTRLDDVEDCDGALAIGVGLGGRLRGPVDCVEAGVSCFFSRNHSYR